MVALLSHLPISKHPLSADDFLWISHIQGSEQLYHLGLSSENPNKSFWQKIQDGFLFYSDKNSSLADQRNYGNMAWWGASEGQLVPFRPISSALLWLDLHLFDQSEIPRQYLSRLYFLFFTLSVFLFYLKVTREEETKKSLSTNLSFVLLSSLFLIFDLSVTHNFFWLAARNSYISLTFALGALIFHMQAREKHQMSYMVLSTSLFTLALLSAEAAISMFGYFIAYAWFKDNRGFMTGLKWIMPYFLIILVWRIIYNFLGFGAIKNGLYTDPGHNLFEFSFRLLAMIPQIFSSLFTGIDGSLQGATLDYRLFIIFLSSLFSLLVIFALRKIILKNATTRFLFLGAVLAIIPHTALISVTSRSNTYAAVGLFYILALAVFSLASYQSAAFKNLIARLSAFLILSYHLILPAIFCTLLFSDGVHFSAKGQGTYSDLGNYLKKNTHKNLVIINHPEPDYLLYSVFEWDQSKQILPHKIQALAPGLSSFSMERISDNELMLVAEQYFVLNQDTPMKIPSDIESHFFHRGHINRYAQSVISSPNQHYVGNEIIEGAEMEVKIISVNNNLVSAFKIIFTGEDKLEDKVWQEFDWASGSYKTTTCPTIGEKRFFKGPF